jgi:hypothetical protein
MIQLNYGDKLRLLCTFQHKGAAYSGAKIHAAIGNKGAFGFDEILWNEVTVNGIKDDVAWYNYSITIDIPITTAIQAGKSYTVYAKLMSIPGDDIFWEGPEKDIQIGEPTGEALFQNLTVQYQKA